MSPRVETIKWGQCDFCSKWRIVDRDLEEDESFCCTDIEGKTCDTPEDSADQVLLFDSFCLACVVVLCSLIHFSSLLILCLDPFCCTMPWKTTTSSSSAASSQPKVFDLTKSPNAAPKNKRVKRNVIDSDSDDSDDESPRKPVVSRTRSCVVFISAQLRSLLVMLLIVAVCGPLPNRRKRFVDSSDEDDSDNDDDNNNTTATKTTTPPAPTKSSSTASEPDAIATPSSQREAFMKSVEVRLCKF